MTLDELYRWMQACIRKEAEPTPEEVEAIICPSSRLTAQERLAIHRDQHWIKTQKALQGQFPNVRRFMGKAAFNDAAVAYLRRNPLRSYSLAHLQHGFPAFLEGQDNIEYAPFLAQLGALEVAIFDVTTEPVEATLTLAAVVALPWTACPLVPIQALRLLSYDYRVLHYVLEPGAHKNEEWAQPSPSWVLLFRSGEQVARYVFTDQEATLLAALQAGQPLDQARHSIDVPHHLVRSKVEAWIEAGMFASLREPA